MSYDYGYEAPAPPPPPRPRVLPPEVNNFVTMFWMALGFGAVLLLILWPEFTGFLPFTMNLFVWFVVYAALVALGAWVSRGITLGNENALRVGRATLLVGMLGGAAALVIFFSVKLSGTPQPPLPGAIPPAGFMGAAPLLGGSLLVFACLLPLFFAMIGFFMASRDEIDHYFHPPLEAEEPLTAEVTSAEVAEVEAEVEAEIVQAEAKAEEAAAEAVAEQALSPGDAAAMEDHEVPLSMGELSLDDEPAEEKKEEEKSD